MNKNKLSSLIVFALLAVSMISFIPFSHATPAGEITYGTDVNYVDVKGKSFVSNFGAYVSMGGWDIYLVCDRFIFYLDGVYVKNYVNPLGAYQLSSPFMWNATHLITSTYKDNVVYLYFLKIATGTWTQITTRTTTYGYHLCPQAIYRKVGSTLYYDAILSYKGWITSTGWCNRVHFTYDGTTPTSTYHDSGEYLDALSPLIFVDSSTSSQEVYVISRTVDASYNRYSVYIINIVADTITVIGNSGNDYTWGFFREGTANTNWGYYVYYIGSEYVEWNAGTQHAYFVFLAYPTSAANNTLRYENLKFNDTSIESKMLTQTTTAPELTVRPIGASPLNGYQIFYTGSDPVDYCLDAVGVIFFTGAGYNIAYQSYEYPYVPFSNLYNSASLGGDQDPASTTAIFIDYTNNKVAPLKMPAYGGAGLYDLSYRLVKAPNTVTGFIYGLYTDTTYYYQFNLTKNYDFVVNGHFNVYFDNVLKAQGIPIYLSKGAFAFIIASSKAGAAHNTTLYFYDHSVSQTTYQVSANYNFYVYASINGTTTSTNPWTTTGTPTGPSDVQMMQGVSWLLMIIVFMPAIVLGFLGARQSADASIFLGMIGLGLSFGLNYLIQYQNEAGVWVHPVPDWIIIFLFVALTFAILYGVINKGGGGGAKGGGGSAKK